MTADTSFVTTTTTGVDSSVAAAFLAFFGMIMLITFVIAIISIIFMWKAFAKAGKPGWAAIVPIYNQVVMAQIIGRPIWWVLLLFVPFFGIWVSIVMLLDLAKAFSHSVGVGIVLVLFPFIGYGILALSKDSIYKGPIAEGYDGFMPVSDDYVVNHSNTTSDAGGSSQGQSGQAGNAATPNSFTSQGVPVSPYTGQPINVPTAQPSGPADVTAAPVPTQPQPGQSADNSGSDAPDQSGQNPTA